MGDDPGDDPPGSVNGTVAPRMFAKIHLPYAPPYIFAGSKVAITSMVVGAVVGEFLGADNGLGYIAVYASGQLNKPDFE